jgi:hypothetical protein
MRKPLASRLIGLAVLYCAVFCILVILQFSNRGNFSLSAGAMTIRGRYLQTPPNSQDTGETAGEGISFGDLSEDGIKPLSGGVKVFFGGLEFTLREDRTKGLTLAGVDGNVTVSPDSMILTDTSARFILPGGTTLAFNSFNTARGPELQINAEFAQDVSEVTIPIAPRRSSPIRENGQFGIMYGGSRYIFSSSGEEIENGKLILSRDNSFVSYRSKGKQRTFDPADYIIAQAQNYESVLRNWQDSSFAYWNQNASSLQNEDDIIAYCAQALQRGNYTAAAGAIPRDFINSSRQSYRSSGFVGGMTGAYRSFTVSENQKLNLVTRLTRERSLEILKEEHILDYLFTRGNIPLANEVIDIINGATPEMLISDYCPGLLEVFYDIRRWRPGTNNPIEHLTEQILLLISENLNRDNENDLVYAAASDGANFEYSTRLGKALVFWADTSQNSEWAGVGRSLILSALTGGSAGKNHNILNPTDYYPRALWLADGGSWAWTVSPAVRTSYVNGNMNIAVSFPVNMTHYLIIRGVRPFFRIQIHGMDWRTDSLFERYDSSGWIYYDQDQTLILKLRHRATLENVIVFYRAEEPPPAVEGNAETSGGDV